MFTENNIPKIIFISWEPYCSRSDNIARELGGKSYKVYYEFLGSNYFTIWLKYFLQIVKSFFILFIERPKVVFVMSPPIFACIPVWIYTRIVPKTGYIIDAHTGSIINPMWKNVMFLHKFFSKYAIYTILTNSFLENVVKKWSVSSFILEDIPIQASKIEVPKLSNKFNITLVNTFARDEPLVNFLEAARKIKEAHFYITGKFTKKYAHLLKNTSPNFTFTDFLPDEKYYGLLQTSDIVVALTNKDHTMQRGAYEAIYMGKPVVTSKWEILKKNFHKGTVFVDNSVEGIISGILNGLKNVEVLQKEAVQLKIEKLKVWEKRKCELVNLIKVKL